MKSKWGPMAAAGLALLLAGAGCDRSDVVRPDTTDDDPILMRSLEPYDLMQSIENAFREHDSAAYEHILGQDFVYGADDQARADYPGVDWDGWDFDKERLFRFLRS